MTKSPTPFMGSGFSSWVQGPVSVRSLRLSPQPNTLLRSAFYTQATASL